MKVLVLRPRIVLKTPETMDEILADVRKQLELGGIITLPPYVEYSVEEFDYVADLSTNAKFRSDPCTSCDDESRKTCGGICLDHILYLTQGGKK